jgi:hypothetical protein
MLGESTGIEEAVMNCKEFEIEWAGMEDASRLPPDGNSPDGMQPVLSPTAG